MIKAGMTGDRKVFQQAVEALAAEERAKQHHVLAEQLQNLAHANGYGGRLFAVPPAAAPAPDLVHESVPKRVLSDLVLTEAVRRACEELVEEHQRAELLRSHNLEPRHRVLLAGPPGNGKTSVAEALAAALFVPLLSVRYDSVIGSFLGETASRLKKVFDHVRTRPCVLFFDEFDTLGKERGDVHDSGEIKRVVSSLLLQIDELPSYVVVVTATNHPELLDRAVWRRFQLRLNLSRPTPGQAVELLGRLERRFQIKFPQSHRQLATALKGASFAELEEFGLGVARQAVLGAPGADLQRITADRLRQWRERFSP